MDHRLINEDKTIENRTLRWSGNKDDSDQADNFDALERWLV